MGVGYKNRDACEGSGAERQKGPVVKDAPTVCPPPIRAKEQKRSKKAHEKQRSSRIATLTRPTASSRAKERTKTLPRSDSVGKNRKECSSPNKKVQKTERKKALDAAIEDLTPVEQDKKTGLKWEVHGPSESPYLDALAECDSDVYFFDNYDINPLLVDVGGDMSYDSFSDDDLSSNMSSCHSALSTCISFEYCEKRERWSKLLSFTHGFACAVSFAAGLSLGMAIGACSLLQNPQSS